MANRRFYQFRYSLEPQVTDLYMQVAIGAAGAPTLNTSNSRGISSITRNSAGNYTVVFQDNYYRTLIAKHMFKNATPSASPDFTFVTDNSSAATSPSVTFVFSSGGVATDPGSGETLFMQFSLKNSSV